MNYTMTVERSWIFDKSNKEIPLVCNFYCSPGRTGTYWEPDEPAEMGIEECWLGDFDIVGFLSDDQREDLENSARERISVEWAEKDAEEADHYIQMKKDERITE